MNIEKGAIGHGNMQNIGFESLEDKEIILKLLKKYGNYLNTSKTETHERYKFFSRTMNDNESIEDFIADLRQKAKTCNFQSLADNFVRDKIIFDTKDEILRQFLLDTEDIDLEKIITIYKIYEKTRGKMNEVCKDKVIQGRNTNITPAIKSAQITCSNCGTHHVYGNCPAFHSRCMKCNGLRHYTKMCNRHWARKNYKRNKSGSNAGGPFSQIKKNRKVMSGGESSNEYLYRLSLIVFALTINILLVIMQGIKFGLPQIKNKSIYRAIDSHIVYHHQNTQNILFQQKLTILDL
ncbi:uncharacterized protein LOC107267509 isoform X2 [Cephus cinctus]|uniref:Uncharacterized protein LOC107267509 isoform X2 n=1 Tax=Cephus cinctus TaxID=211228 RepID=A0AAJ7RGW4_CEPCN|nr:uncharacterized protein LOC107267509 isoform X2 [Cephus cinctus]